MDKKIIFASFFLIIFFSTLSMAEKEGGPYQDLYLKVGDIKIHYLEAGSGDRILVFIPGWTMPAEVWKEQIPYFSSRGFHVIALDLRSQGLTTKTETGNTFEQQAADLHAFFHTLKIEPFYLVGWASGVTVLLDYISSSETLKPEKMVFVDGSPAALKSDDYPGSITAQQARKLIFGFQDNRAKATEQWIRSLFKVNQMESLIKELKEGSMRTPMSAALSLYFDYFSGDRRPSLNYITVPNLIVTTSANRAIGEYMKSKIANSRLEVIDGTGSAIFLDRPQAFNQLLEAFLEENK
jgi:non-heme chloroperoxidase